LPPSPKPQPGEQKLGDVRVGGVMEPIFKSFVPSGLWWFNGATPSLGALYPTTAVLPLASIGPGDFSLKVSKGADKVSLEGTGAVLTGKDLTEAKVLSLAPSVKQNDIRIDVQHRAPGAKKLAHAASVDLTVRVPERLGLLGTDDRPAGANGYDSVTSLRVFDNLGQPLPYIDTNEDFTTGKLEPGADKAWGESLATRHKGKTITLGNAVFQDNYAVNVSGSVAGMKPMPSNPQTPRSTELALSFEHDWFAGSASTGHGVHVSHHVGRFFADHAEYTDFTSPPGAGAGGGGGRGAGPAAPAPPEKKGKGKK
jgi:hypothetical protein